MEAKEKRQNLQRFDAQKTFNAQNRGVRIFTVAQGLPGWFAEESWEVEVGLQYLSTSP